MYNYNLHIFFWESFNLNVDIIEHNLGTICVHDIRYYPILKKQLRVSTDRQSLTKFVRNKLIILGWKVILIYPTKT